MLHPKSQCYMNVIPPYGRPAFISLVSSMDDIEKEFTSIPSVDELHDPKGRAMFPAKLPSHTVSLNVLPAGPKPIAIE